MWSGSFWDELRRVLAWPHGKVGRREEGVLCCPLGPLRFCNGPRWPRECAGVWLQLLWAWVLGRAWGLCCFGLSFLTRMELSTDEGSVLSEGSLGSLSRPLHSFLCPFLGWGFAVGRVHPAAKRPSQP